MVHVTLGLWLVGAQGGGLTFMWSVRDQCMHTGSLNVRRWLTENQAAMACLMRNTYTVPVYLLAREEHSNQPVTKGREVMSESPEHVRQRHSGLTKERFQINVRLFLFSRNPWPWKLKLGSMATGGRVHTDDLDLWTSFSKIIWNTRVYSFDCDPMNWSQTRLTYCKDVCWMYAEHELPSFSISKVITWTDIQTQTHRHDWIYCVLTYGDGNTNGFSRSHSVH